MNSGPVGDLLLRKSLHPTQGTDMGPEAEEEGVHSNLNSLRLPGC